MKINIGLRAKVIICIITSLLVSISAIAIIFSTKCFARCSYYSSIISLDAASAEIAKDFSNRDNSSYAETAYYTYSLGAKYRGMRMDIYIVNSKGEIMCKSEGTKETIIDFKKVYGDARFWMSYKDGQKYNDYAYIFPLQVENENLFGVVMAKPIGRYESNFEGEGIIVFFIGVIIFAIIYYLLSNVKIKYIKELCSGVMEISSGNLDYTIETKGNDELQILAEKINFMTKELKNKIEYEKRLEESKNELITNVSHDLRTPLTSIMGYIEILRTKTEDMDDDTKKYLEIMIGKSNRLKKMMDDLFVYTKLTTNKQSIEKNYICLNELMEQVIDEYIPLIEHNKLKLKEHISKEKISIIANIDMLVRVFDNLFNNAAKYSIKPSLVSFSLEKIDDSAMISIENECSELVEIDVEKVFERFYIGDKSRSISGASSGLGLAICKSIVKLNGGEIWAEAKDRKVKFIMKFTLIKEGR
ncbi:MAG: HAMP domain-containing sensor histidine kinase [Bacillota bacterium]|nr:HAMP domain-containing sensor histidine kinase [Bacillota bacterium]